MKIIRKGQGALEYLLLIGGAILVTVIVIALIVGLTGGSEGEATLAVAHGLCAKYPDNQCSGQVVQVKGQNFGCVSNGTNQCRAIKGIPITACGDPSGGWVNGKTYFLANDISTAIGPCLSISAPNVKLYCSNKKITVTVGQGIRVSTAGANNILVDGCQIDADGSAFWITTSNNIISNNSLKSTAPEIHILGSGANNQLVNNFTCVGGTGRIYIQSIAGQLLSSGNSCTNGLCTDDSGLTVICNPAALGNCNISC